MYLGNACAWKMHTLFYSVLFPKIVQFSVYSDIQEKGNYYINMRPYLGTTHVRVYLYG